MAEILDAEVNSPENIRKRIEAVQPNIVKVQSVVNMETIAKATDEMEEAFEHLDEVEANQSTSLIHIKPEQDAKVIALYQEGMKLRDFAVTRIILTNDDLTPATNDLAIIKKTKNAIEELRKEYVNPIRHQLDTVNGTFKDFTAPLDEANTINRQKVQSYQAEVARQVAEAEAINRDKLDLARREMELKGEYTVDLSPTETPELRRRVHAEMGSTSTQKNYKWEVDDISKIPREYLMPNHVLIGQVVRSSKGMMAIPGIRTWAEDAIRVNTR